MTLNENERARYQRQMLISGWGEEGQQKLRSSTVFVAGAGGLGCPVSVFLAVAGIGTIRICDNGLVEHSNLNRQILYNDRNVGKKKVYAAGDALMALNPHVAIEPLEQRITEQTAADLVGNSTIIVDCLDNFTARHVLNRFAVNNGIPLVHAAIEGLAGQMTFIQTPDTPCLHCIFPGIIASKEPFPVAGATPGIVGSLSALEAIKWLTGIGNTLKGRLLMWDGKTMDWETIAIQKDPQCPVCAG